LEKKTGDAIRRKSKKRAVEQTGTRPKVRRRKNWGVRNASQKNSIEKKKLS